MMKKITSLVVALALVAGVFGAVTASAATIAELQAMIASLTQQLAALSGGTTTSTGATTFTSNLSVGSRGAQVSALQEALNTEVDAGLPVTGYFGALTKAAVIKFQKANSISGTGTVGPLTRAALNALQAPVTVPDTTTPGTGTPATSLDNTDGSVTATQSSIAPSTQSMTKGDTKNIYAIRFSAVSGKVNVNRIDVNFTDRPWLIFNQVVLKDASGNVLATKTLNSEADVTEVSVGSSYNVRFDNLNVVVTPGTDTNLVVSATVSANNSYIATSPYDATTVSIPSSGIRTINGKGYTDSTTVSGTDVVTLTSAGSTADLSAVVAPTSPIGPQVNISAAGGSPKTNVPLAVYRFRSSNLDSTLNTLVFNINTIDASGNELGSRLSNSLTNFTLSDGTNTFYGSLSGKAVTFTLNNSAVKLTKDVVKDLTLSADIAATSTLYSASTSLAVSSISAIDANYVAPTYGGSTMSGLTTTFVTGSNLTFTPNTLTVSGVSLGTSSGQPDASSRIVQYEDSFTMTLNNGSTNNLFISTLGGDVFGTSSSPTNSTTTVKSNITVSGAALSGDATTGYVIPAGGSRTFTFKAIVGKALPASTSQTLTIANVRYGTTAAAPSGSTLTVSGLVFDHSFIAF